MLFQMTGARAPVLSAVSKAMKACKGGREEGWRLAEVLHTASHVVLRWPGSGNNLTAGC
jgi:hypothetical protein